MTLWKEWVPVQPNLVDGATVDIIGITENAETWHQEYRAADLAREYPYQLSHYRAKRDSRSRYKPCSIVVQVVPARRMNPYQVAYYWMSFLLDRLDTAAEPVEESDLEDLVLLYLAQLSEQERARDEDKLNRELRDLSRHFWKEIV